MLTVSSPTNTERINRKRSYYSTVYKGLEYDSYSYDEYAINDGDEWRSLEETRWPKLAKREREAKVFAFEQQQKAMYQMLPMCDKNVLEGTFVKTFHETLKSTDEGMKASGELSIEDEKEAHQFFLVKKKIYDAKVESEAARSSAADVTAKLQDASEDCKDLISARDTARSEYHEVCEGPSGIPAGVAGLVGSFGISAMGDPAILALFAAKALAPSLEQGLAMGLAQLTGAVGGDANASLVVAATVGLGAALATKVASYVAHRTSSRRAIAKLKSAKASVAAAKALKRQLKAEKSEARRKHKGALQKERECCLADKTGCVYPSEDEGEEDEEDDEEEGEEQSEQEDDEAEYAEYVEDDEEVNEGEEEADDQSDDDDDDDDDEEEEEEEEADDDEEADEELDEADEELDEADEEGDESAEEEGAAETKGAVQEKGASIY